MKLNIIRGILITALMAIFVTIFGFSNQNAETSAGLSQKVTNFVVELIPSIKNLPEQEKEKVTDRIAVSLIIGVIYASTDEIHQVFVPGRGPLITDVILDSIGVLTGIFIVMLVLKVYMEINNRKYKDVT